MTTLIQVDQEIAGQCYPWPGDDDDFKMRARREVTAGFLDGHQGPRTCVRCKTLVVGAPIVSEGLPYHIPCYHLMRAKEKLDDLRENAQAVA